MKKFNIWFEYICGLPKTVYFNFKCLPFLQAIKLPIFISHRVILASLKGKFVFDCGNVKTGMVKIGFGYVGIFDRYRSRSIIENGGTLVFRGGNINIGHGSKISVLPGGCLSLGRNFSITAESQICAKKLINIGENVLMSWQCLVMDTDWHSIYFDGTKVNEDMAIDIEDNVWVGCRSTILKGAVIHKGCVIGANSNVVGVFTEKNCIIAGNPARIVKKHITWEK